MLIHATKSVLKKSKSDNVHKVYQQHIYVSKLVVSISGRVFILVENQGNSELVILRISPTVGVLSARKKGPKMKTTKKLEVGNISSKTWKFGSISWERQSHVNPWNISNFFSWDSHDGFCCDMLRWELQIAFLLASESIVPIVVFSI